MTQRLLAAAVLSLALLTPAPALAQAPEAADAENVEFIANLPLAPEDVQKNEIELAGDYAYVSSDLGLHIVDITDPLRPKEVGSWRCEAGWGDVDLTADAKVAVLTNAHFGECLKTGGDTAIAILDVSDVTAPKLLSKIDLSDEQEYVHTATVDGDHLFLNIQEAVFYPQASRVTPVYDISDPANPVKVVNIEFPAGEEGVNHDSYIDNRPDGARLMYGASVHATDVFDITRITEPTRLQRFYTLDMTISHQAEPNHDRSLLIVEDESAVDGYLVGAPGAVCGKAGSGSAAFDVGSTMFFPMAEDGTVSDRTGSMPVGSYNRSFEPHTATCTAHVFWQAPDENRLTQAWYSSGARIIDFSDPANPYEIGSFDPEGDTMYWSAKAHRGYIFATDMTRGLDVLKYTGEGGERWPATAGYADYQRNRRMGIAWTPPGEEVPGPGSSGVLPEADTSERALGRFSISKRVRVPGRRSSGRKRALRLRFFDSAGERVGSYEVRKRAGRRARVRARGIAEAGTYRWTLKAGRKRVGRGRFVVAEGSDRLTMERSRKLVARVR